MRSRAKPEIVQEFIYRPWITTRNGRRIFAKEFGLIAFKIPKRY